MTEFVAYILIRIAAFSLNLMPMWFSLMLARRVGGLAFLFNTKRRRLAYANLKAAFRDEKTPKEYKRIIKHLYQHLAMGAIEVLRFPRMDKRYIARYINVEGANFIEEAQRENRGIIFLTGHFGNWELANIYCCFRFGPLVVLAREQKQTQMNAFLDVLRTSHGSRVVGKGMAVRELIRHLQNKGMTAILADQDGGKQGIFVELFGRPASFRRGVLAFARATDAAILPGFIVRRRGAHHAQIIESALAALDLDTEEGERKALQEFARILERYVRQYPEQWLWLHKRWKSTSVRYVLILSDGKAGHLNQAKAVAEEIERALRDTSRRAIIQTVEVKYKSRLHRLIHSLCAIFASKYCQGCMQCCRRCLTDESFKNLMNTYADIVISCGASVAPLNLFMKYENNAKNILIMKPGHLGYKRFDLAIVPRHDNPPRRKNIIATLGAPNLVPKLPMKEGPLNIGFLVGGTIEVEFLKDVLKAADELDASIYASTSRRTAKESEVILKEALSNNPRTKMLVIASEDNPLDTVSKILETCQIILVSAESISMLSEAASQGRYVLAYSPARPLKSKYEYTIMMLAMNKFIYRVSASNVKDKIAEVWTERPPIHTLDDNNLIFDAVRGML